MSLPAWHQLADQISNELMNRIIKTSRNVQSHEDVETKTELNMEFNIGRSRDTAQST